jgi:hypothetical protein
MAMPGEAEQDVKRRLRCEQQGGDSAGGQPPVREGHACAGQQSRTEEKRSGGGETSAGNDVPGRGHKQAGSRQREAAKDSSPSARQRLHGHSLEAELSRRKGGSNVRFAQTDKPAGSAGAATVPNVASWDDVRRLALALPGTAEAPSHDGLPAWRVKDKLFVWERPLRRSDLEALGDRAPDGPILGVRVEHLVAKEALLADDPGVFFTMPHFDGYPAVLARLDRIATADLEELVTEAWLAPAPKRLVTRYMEASA